MTEDDLIFIQQFSNPKLQERAFSSIVKKYQERLYWQVRRIVIVHEDADDVMQNVWIKCWKNLSNFRGDSSLFTWLYRIATNESLTYLEQQKKRASASLNEDDESSHYQKLKAEDGFDYKKLEWRLQQGIQSLPEKQRVVFCLRYYDEMPYEKMSEITGTSVGALKASYFHAVKKIEEIIKKD